MKVKFVFLMALTGLVFGGCVSEIINTAGGTPRGFEAAGNRAKIVKKNIQPGMEMKTFSKIMGSPDKIGYQGDYQVLYYVTEWINDGKDTEEELTPFVFKEGILQGVGRDYLTSLKK